MTNTAAPDIILKTDFSFEMSQHGIVYLWWSSFASHSRSSRVSTPAAAARSARARQLSEPGQPIAVLQPAVGKRQCLHLKEQFEINAD